MDKPRRSGRNKGKTTAGTAEGKGTAVPKQPNEGAPAGKAPQKKKMTNAERITAARIRVQEAAPVRPPRPPSTVPLTPTSQVAPAATVAAAGAAAAGGAPPPPAATATGKGRAVPYVVYGGFDTTPQPGTMKSTTENVGKLLFDKAQIMAALKASIKKIDGSVQKDVLMAVKTLIHAIILGTTISNTNWGVISEGIVNASATMGPVIQSLAETVMENVGSGTLESVYAFQNFLLSGSWGSGIFIGLLASAIATNKQILKVILDSYSDAIGETKKSVEKSMDTIIKRLQPGYLKTKIWGIMKGANNALGGSILQPLVDGLNKKIETDTNIDRGVLETNIDTIKRQVNEIFTKDAVERKKAKKAKDAGFGSDDGPAEAVGRTTSLGGRRTKRRRRGKKSRKHTKKKTKRKRKHSRSTKRRQRRSKLGKRRTKRRGKKN